MMKHVFVRGQVRSYSFLLPEVEMAKEPIEGTGRVEIGGVPYNLSKWSIQPAPPDPEERRSTWHMGALSQYMLGFQGEIEHLVFWDTVKVTKSPITIQVLNGTILPIASFSIHPYQRLPRTTDFGNGGFNAEVERSYVPTVVYPEGETMRWLGNDPYVIGLLNAAMRDEVDGRSSSPPIEALADYWEERGDTRGEKVRTCKNYGEVCFFLKFGVSYADAAEAIKASMERASRDIAEATQVMNESFLSLAEIIREAGRHLATLGEDHEHRKPDGATQQLRRKRKGHQRAVQPKD